MNLYSIFHINTSYSSLEKKNIKNVLKLCYWPLLNLIERYDFKIGIEASANSLIEINNIDKSWLKKLRYLIYKKKVEFIGSGYSQAIFPIIPFEVNNMNLKLGDEAYKKILTKLKVPSPSACKCCPTEPSTMFKSVNAVGIPNVLNENTPLPFVANT